VIALVIRQVPLQEVEALVDVVDQADLAAPEMDGPDAAGSDGPSPLGDLIVDVRGGHHRLGAFGPGLVLQSAEDLPLASGESAMDTGVHSRTSSRRRVEVCQVLRLFPESSRRRVLRADAA
jgi:hypothetical protein